MIEETPGYRIISDFYGTKTADRSGVPLMNHVNEGIEILRRIGSDQVVMEAFAVHPVFQSDENLQENFCLCDDLHPLIVLYVMEYRSVANSFLSDNIAYGPGAWGSPAYFQIRPSKPPILKAVKEMLIADKVQNRKDFELYHKNSHDRAGHLDFYFKTWLARLGISEEQYQELIKDL